MSTRAVFTFKDADDRFNVYKHYDGYPSEAAKCIEKALKFAWRLPRFEPDEFAAAFVAANKDREGDIRLKHTGFQIDASYVYSVWFSERHRALWVQCYSAEWSEERSKQVKKLLFQGTLDDFCDWSAINADA